MPMYDWCCKKCGKIETLILPLAEYETRPEETGSEECKEHDWEKVLLGAPGKAYAPGWGSVRKGNYGRDG